MKFGDNMRLYRIGNIMNTFHYEGSRYMYFFNFDLDLCQRKTKGFS